MRLKQIKLAGFKSFVDPTLAPFPDNLTAIVGPNGCGKSNIIDAVRWVMGESSAKHLRGDSMSDVIFNGSSARKPVALASVELVFDNSEGKLQGEYTNYNEISTTRQVTREGQSSYFLNGTRCRRKDITDIFLGTGLGPRSYAIIEQGMISRLIESKPQELRVFIEEAAGISKYKERRRETENRIRHTKDNLDRLSDLREELGNQLERLQRQANAARKFKEFKSDERRLKAELAAIRWQQLNSTYTEGQRHLQNLELEYEAKTTEQRSIDARLEASREEHRELNDALNEVQARFYRIGADISRFEQSLEHIKSRKAQINDDLAQAATAQQHAESHQTIDKEKVDELLLELEELEPQLMELEDVIDSSNDELSTLESEMNDWQAEWENYNKSASENKKKAEVLQTRISHSETIMTRIQHKVVKLEEERLAIESEENDDDEAVREAAEELEITKLSAFEAQQKVEQIYDSLEEKRAVLKEKNQKLSHLQKSVNALRSRKISIEALQNAALNDKSSNTLAWIDECNLDDAPRLAQLLDVEPGWTTAVESVLSEELDSICVSSVEAYLEKIKDDLSVQLLDTQALEDVPGKTPGSLREKIKNGFQFPIDLSSIKVAHTLPEAIAMREALQAGESVVTKDGIWLGHGWIKVKSADSGTNGVLERANELKVVSEELAAAESDAQQQQAAIESLSDALLADEKNWRESQNKLNETNQQYAKLQTVVGTQQAKIEQLKKRKQRILQEIDDNGGQLDEEQEALSTCRMELEGIVDLMSDDIGRQESLQEKKEEKRNLLDSARQKVKDQKEQQHRLHLRAESIKTELNTTKKQQQRSQEQLIQLNDRIQSLTVILEENEEAVPELEENLEEALESRVAVEEELTVSKEKADQTEQILRQLEKDRTSYEQGSQDIRGRLEKCRLECQGLLMQKGTQEEQIKELDVDLTQLLDSLPENSNEKEWVSQLDRMSGKIQRLGAINLAAIEEYESQSQRKEYLDAQNDDLLSALETLENAIRKIDKETRDRFKDTFDKVNDGIQELFPKVFGGGHAYLELTGDDLLDTGVAIMARPPGKKNSTIHLLSGGEKALTALSLVFSIFRLNPAPFCLLDEVDAPLDDANVNRFCKLVKEMSKQVQFIFISHNKVAMEMANHMQGVTMHEPGVSRLVSVDIDEAASLVNA